MESNVIEAQASETAVQNDCRVLKHQSDTFVIDCNGTEREARARGKFKKKGGILVGDYVTAEKDDAGGLVITSVGERRNELSRPAIANVDLIVIVAAPVPLIDYYLVDKLVIHCMRAGIEYVICCNKTDISKQELPLMRAQYRRVADKIITTSATEGEVDELRPLLTNKLTCFAGQSAVGKSSLSNTLLGSGSIRIGAVSEKVGRGRNTTTATQIYRLSDNTYIADTPGFSMLDQAEIQPEELCGYYPEFEKYEDKCRFSGCRHAKEPGCGVRAAVEAGRINNERYARYKHMYEELIIERRKKR